MPSRSPGHLRLGRWRRGRQGELAGCAAGGAVRLHGEAARGGAQPAVAHWDAATALPRLALEAPGIAAPGQAVVLYDGDRALGGGSIRAAEAGAQAPRRAVA